MCCIRPDTAPRNSCVDCLARRLLTPRDSCCSLERAREEEREHSKIEYKPVGAERLRDEAKSCLPVYGSLATADKPLTHKNVAFGVAFLAKHRASMVSVHRLCQRCKRQLLVFRCPGVRWGWGCRPQSSKLGVRKDHNGFLS